MNYYNQALPSLSMGEALRLSTSRLTQFSGRSRRSEYWWTVLAVMLASVVISILSFLGVFISEGALLVTYTLGSLISLLLGLAMLPLTFRRLHDAGHSALWLLPLPFFMVAYVIAFAIESLHVMGFQDGVIWLYFGFYGLVYLAYSIVLLVFTCQDSQPYTNRYGESPKYPQRQANYKQEY